MKNSAKRNVIVSALLSIVMCISLIVGVTLAVVTSESKVNIAITGAKIDVVATVDENSIQQKQLNTDYSATGKTYSGEAEIVGGTVSLKNFVAGDGIKFNIVVENKSTVTVNYRTVLAIGDYSGLFELLNVTVDGEKFDGNTLYSSWQSVGVGSGDATIAVEIELPANTTNFSGKTCDLMFAVEAVQGNAEVDNFVAKIGEVGYETIDEAVAALNEGDTLEITRPGIYAPFKITKENVTVKGIIGDSMATSTIIRNTATSNIKAYADGITLENLWIDSTTPQSISWMNSGAIDPYISTNAGIVAQDLTINGCIIDGTGEAGSFAFLYCGQTITITNNTFNDFETAYSAMCDNGSLTKAIVTGNTFNNVLFPVSGYWGAAMSGTDYNIEIKGNTFDDNSIVHLWDYYQYQNRNSATAPTKVAVKAQISGNKGNYSVVLTHNNWLVDNGNDIEKTVNVSYRRLVKFNVDSANYKVYNADGSEINTVMYDSTTLGNQGGYLALYAITEGEYLIKNTVSGAEYAFTVKAMPVGETQVVTLISAPASGESSADVISDVIKNSDDQVELNLASGTYTLPSLENKDVTFIGTKDTVIDMVDKVNKANSVAFEGVTVNFGSSNYKGFQHTAEAVYKNCVINGFMTTYGDMTFENCTFNSGDNQYSINFYGGENFTLTNCHFYGVNKNVYLFQETLDSDKNVTFNGCDFHMSATDTTKNKSAIMLNAPVTYNGFKYNVVINNCTAEGACTTAAENVAGNENYQGLYGLKHKDGYGNAKLVLGTVTVNNTKVYEN